jgi:hypothetical protein
LNSSPYSPSHTTFPLKAAAAQKISPKTFTAEHMQMWELCKRKLEGIGWNWIHTCRWAVTFLLSQVAEDTRGGNRGGEKPPKGFVSLQSKGFLFFTRLPFHYQGRFPPTCVSLSQDIFKRGSRAILNFPFKNSRIQKRIGDKRIDNWRQKDRQSEK